MSVKPIDPSMLILMPIFIDMVERHSPKAANQIRELVTIHNPYVICAFCSLLMDFWHYCTQRDYTIDVQYYAEFCLTFPTASRELDRLWQMFYAEALQRELAQESAFIPPVIN